MKNKSQDASDSEKKVMSSGADLDKVAFLRLQEKTFDDQARLFAGKDAVTVDVYQRLCRMVRLGLARRLSEDGLRVLDVGAGCGVLTGILLEMNPQVRVIAVDLSERMLAVLTKRHPGVKAVQSDILAFNSPSDFDSVWFNACFGNLLEPSSVLRHIARQMSYGAKLHITHPMGRAYQEKLHVQDPEVVPHTLPGALSEAERLAAGTGLVAEQLVDEDRFYMLSYRLK